MTLNSLGLLIESVVPKLVPGDVATDLSKDKIIFEERKQYIGTRFPAYIMQGSGVNGTHALFVDLVPINIGHANDIVLL